MDLLKAVSSAVNKGGAALEIEDVFSTYLYKGKGATQGFVTGIDLATEGGLFWSKKRNSAYSNVLMDTERGTDVYMQSDTTDGDISGAGTLAYGTDSVTLSSSSLVNNLNDDYVSWIFRKAPRFFDVVKYTGNSTDRTIPHNLGCDVGMIIIKSTTNGGTNWRVYHRGIGAGNSIYFNLTNASGANTDIWQNTTPTDSEFYLGGGDTDYNVTGNDYIAYLFADDPLGPSGDGSDGLIACDSVSVLSYNASVTLGWEPQWVMIKSSSETQSWYMVDMMRGMDYAAGLYLQANSSAAEASGGPFLRPTPTGFDIVGLGGAATNNIVYMAIRRPMRTPESSDEVFYTSEGTATSFSFGYGKNGSADVAMLKETGASNFLSGTWQISNRLTGLKPFTDWTINSVTGSPYLNLDSTNAESTTESKIGVLPGSLGVGGHVMNITAMGNHAATNPTVSFYAWKRATGFFDVVCYEGTGIARTVDHNLGVVPEMIWVKSRETLSAGNANWVVYSEEANNTNKGYLYLNEIDSYTDNNTFWDNTAPSTSQFTLSSNATVNDSGKGFIAYLFATLANVSKVGSYTGNGSSQTLDCGFASGAKFVLIKRTDDTGDWMMWDSVRGIVAGDDPYLELNTTVAEVTGTDSIDPDTSGFIVNYNTSSAPTNDNGATYIYYAISN